MISKNDDTQKELPTFEDIVNVEYPSFLDGLSTEEFDDVELPEQEELLKRIKSLPPQVPLSSFIDNTDYIQHVQVEKPSKTEPDVGDYILMTKGKISFIGFQSDVLEKVKDLLYKDELKMSDLVVLKRISIKAGVFFES